MIKPSKRQEKEAPQLFKTHLKLAAKRNRNKRLSTAGIAASICSLILWLFGVSLFIHVLGVLISFAIGFFFPVGKAHSWALDLIAKDTGLSYQTALEQQDKVQESAYNLLEPLNQHAHKMIRRLSEPSLRRWWLPLLVLAFGLTLLPVSPFSSSPRALGLPSNLNPLGSAPDEEQGQTSTPAETQANEPNTQTPNQPHDDTSESGSPQTLDDASGASGEGLGDISENVADEEALSRFLENLRERDLPEEQETESPQPNNSQPSASEGEPDPNAEPREGEGGDSQNSEGEGQQGAEEGDSENEGRESSDRSGESTDSEGDEESDTGEEGGDSSEAQSDEEGANTTGSQPDSDGLGDSDPSESANEGSDGSGDLPSGSQTSLGIVGQETISEPEFLEGQLQQGQSNLAGTVRLPGSSDQEAGSPGSSASGFQQAEEQAVTEGSIPIEYQEIIRNYFR